MIKVMEQLIQFMPVIPAGSLRDNFVVLVPESPAEASEHASNGEVELVVSVERRWIEYHWTIRNLCGVATPQVAVEERWLHFDVVEVLGEFQLKLGPEFSSLSVPIVFLNQRQLLLELPGVKINPIIAPAVVLRDVATARGDVEAKLRCVLLALLLPLANKAAVRFRFLPLFDVV